MSEINIHDSNKLIIDKYFNNLTCDEYTESIFKGGQSQADERLANIDIKGYSKKRNNVYPATTRVLLSSLHIYVMVYSIFVKLESGG